MCVLISVSISSGLLGMSLKKLIVVFFISPGIFIAVVFRSFIQIYFLWIQSAMSLLNCAMSGSSGYSRSDILFDVYFSGAGTIMLAGGIQFCR